MKLLLTLSLFLGFTYSFSQLTATIDFQLNPFCAFDATGEFQISVTGGTAPYTFTSSPVIFQTVSIDADTEYFLGVQAGTYTITIQDATMATTDINVTLMDPPPLIATTVFADDTCGLGVGSITFDMVTGGVAPYLYSIDNGATLQPSNVFPNLSEGLFIATVQDANGCFAMAQPTTIQIQNSLLGGGSAQGTITASPSYCNDGSISLQITSGIPPFNVTWNSGDSLFLLNNVGPGTYTATVTDSSNCAAEFQVVVADSSAAGGCSQISGRVYSDNNNNCTDETEPGINNVALKANPGNYTILTNPNGEYEFNLPYGNYTIEQIPAFNTVSNCVSSYNVLTNAGSPTSSGNDFPDSLYSDFESIFSPGLIRPVMPSYQVLYTKNHTSLNDIVTIYYVPDANYIVDSIYPAYDNMNGDTMFWTNVNMTSFEIDMIQIFGHTNEPLGTPLVFCHGVNPQGYDHVPSNNQACHTAVVIGSFDPNDKQVWPQGDIHLTDEELTYKIRFQNTGTDTAFNVFIIDTLSQYLDASTFQFVSASHYCIPEIINNNVLKFSFPNIMLVDSNTNEPLSHGHVIFRIKQNSSNQVGDVIENTAGIYFDYNEPVITNTTSSPIVQEVANVNEFKLENLSVYPNPASDEFTVVYPNNTEGVISFFDAQGRIVYTQDVKNQKQQKINASNWEKGIYLIQFKSQTGLSTGKIIIE